MKKFLLTLLAVVVLASSLVVSTSAAEIPTDGLIGNYHFEGDLVNAVDNEAGTPMMDIFAEALYEDITDPDRYWFTGVEGNAFYCGDGDGAQLMAPGAGDWTMGVWVTEIDNTGIHPYIWYGGQNQSPENWIGLWNVDIGTTRTTSWGRVGLVVGSNNTAGTRTEILPGEYALYDEEAEVILQWTHVVMVAVLDDETDPENPTYTITMYVNGEEAGSNTGFPQPATQEDACIYLNGVNAWGDPNSGGALDELVVYNKALSADEVATLYGAYTTPATYDSLDAWNEAIVVVEAEGDDTTAAPEDDDTTAAPEDDDTTAAPAGDDDADDTTAAPEEEGGCGSSMGAAAAIVALVSILGCAIVKKH